MKPIYVFGHKNPDTDSICSAIAYAYLKNTQMPGHVAARLGELNRETRFILDTFDIPEPIFLPHLHLRVQDIMTQNVVCASVNSTVYEVGQLMYQHQVHYVPMVDEKGRALGLVTERNLARGYLKEFHVPSLHDMPTELGKITQTLNGRLLVGEPSKRVCGKTVIGAMDEHTMSSYISSGDLVILSNSQKAQQIALESDISCLIITDGFEPSSPIKQIARARGSAIIVTPHDTFSAARLINLSTAAERLLLRKVLTVSPQSLVSEVTPELLESKPHIALVNDNEGRLIGIISKSDIVTSPRLKVILVDHSERSQSAEGIEHADILEILDHHRLGGLETTGPMLAMIAPVGCTATLVLRRYKELGVKPPRSMAGLMLSAILSDTMLLKSPTTTRQDVEAVKCLGKIIGEDPMAFGKRMYNAKFDLTNLSPADIITNDFKSFVFGRANVGIGQVEVGDKEMILTRKAEILAEMTRYQLRQGFDLMVLMVTDILREGTELIAVGKTRLVEWAFNRQLNNHSVYLPGVLSRKKQVVPPILGAVA